MRSFISYSWSNATHENWVLALATELRNSGVDVILDKWDLKEGHDAIAFMEEMVNNPEIKKVIIISDKKYADKANGRDGGVGTETQIISKEIYDNVKQDKFVAVVAEKDENGKPYLPTYYKSRIYIDLSESEKYADNFEILLRWIFDMPLHKKPSLGQKPAFLNEKGSIELGTSFTQKRLISAIKENKEILNGALSEYLTMYSENFEKLRIVKPDKKEYDELIFEMIDSFKPYKNEFLQVIFNFSQYGINENINSSLHRFFESLIHYLSNSENNRVYTDWDFDVYKFIIRELFLNTIAILLKYEKFESVGYLLSHKYYLNNNLGYGETLTSFTIFENHLNSFDYRIQRLSLRRLSLRADLLKERSENSGIDFRYIMQADFTLFINTELNNKFGRWWPDTLIYSSHTYNAFEVFARAQSKTYFDKMKCILNVDSIEQVNLLLKDYKENKRNAPRWEFHSFDPEILIGIEKLAKEK